ncbi:lipopolysaccharide biosynthesis protein [Rhodococcus sp. SJ-3]|uniref:lipopolysaccharide biosynthesis protein n=1 Tax=Rhodococcus sp. SJ-3 TaxID=3454628 RepID=UPI003F7A1568
MKDLIWAFLERVFPRAASALVMLGMTFFITPSAVGVYAIGILILTLFQAATDSAIRQVAVPALNTPSGRRFLDRYKLITPIIGVVAITLALASVYLALKPQDRQSLVPLLLFAFIPPVTAFRVTAIARLQKAGKWKALANYQLIAAISSFAVSVPVLLIAQSLLAPTLQLLITELLFTIQSRRKSNAISGGPDGNQETSTKIAHEFAHLSLYSVIAWTQSQADRVLLTPIAGTDKLGEYTVATSIARSAGDAISTSTANVLRPKLFDSTVRSPERVSQTAEDVLKRATPVAFGATIATIAGVQLLLRPLLDATWDNSLDAAVILSLATGPTLFAWCMTVILIAAERVKWAAPVKMIGALCSVPIAIAAVDSIQFAAGLAVMREVIVMLILVSVAGKYAPLKSLALACALYAALSFLIIPLVS